MPTRFDRPRKLRTGLCAAALLCALVLSGVGAAGAVFTDRTLLTQYLSWLPGIAIPPAAAFAALAAVALTRAPRWGWKRRLPKLPVLVAVLCLGTSAALAVSEWRLTAWRPSLSGAPYMSVFHWNMTSNGSAIWEEPYSRLPGVGRPDVLMVSTTQPLKRFKKSCADLGEGYHLRRIGLFSIASRYPIIQWVQRPLFTEAQRAQLGLDRRPPKWAVGAFNSLARDAGASERDFDDPEWGTVNFVCFDTTALRGRSTTVWFIDLPSNPLVHRERLALLARAQIERLASEITPVDAAPAGFPDSPDLVLGDLNIPRGAGSLGVLLPGFTNAAVAAEPGRLASWPRAFPLWHLDQAFVPPGVRPERYEIIDPGSSDHRAQVLTIAFVDSPPGTPGSTGKTTEDRAELDSTTEVNP